MGTNATILILVLYALILAAGIYFKSYFDKKGANLATKEDFKDLKAQTAELRLATKEIEAKIDEQIWSRQRQWELKRDILVKLAATISDFEQSVMGISNKVENRSNSLREGELFNAALARWNEQSDKFERDSFVAGLVVTIETRRAMGDLSKALRDATTDILGQQKNAIYRTHHRNIVMKLEIARGHIRDELGIAPLFPTPQSSVSSAEKRRAD
jgi:hypothetical protein